MKYKKKHQHIVAALLLVPFFIVLSGTQAIAATAVSNTGMTSHLKLSIMTTANDVIAPSIPKQLKSISANNSSQVIIQWNAASDNIAVSAYRVYRNGRLLSNVSNGQQLIDTDISPGQSYEYQVSAIDAKNNESKLSAALKITVNFDTKLLIPSEGGEGKAFNDGASWTHFNKGAGLIWKNKGGDYIDVNGVAQGTSPWAEQTIIDTNSTKPIMWNVTTLVQAWNNQDYPNRGFHLRQVSGSTGPVDYVTQEHSDSALRPLLTVTTKNSGTLTFSPQVDTHLTSYTSTLTAGQDTGMRVRNNTNNIILWFDLESLKGKLISSAELKLTTTAQYTNSDSVHGLFAVTTTQWDNTAPVQGLAAQYPNDKGIANHPDVYLHYSFDSNDVVDGGQYLSPTATGGHAENYWSCEDLSPVGRQKDGSQSTPAPGIPGYKAMDNGNALCLRIKYEDGPPNTQGLGNYGVSIGEKVGNFSNQQQTDELFVRIYIFLGETWGENIKQQGGKRPGGITGRQANTAYAAGWGGRTTNGANGWSARGGYAEEVPFGNNPFEGYTPFTTYLYHADQSGAYGDAIRWNKTPNGLIKKGQWHSIEQQVTMNTRDGKNIKGSSGAKDGIVRGWVDGRLVFEKTNVRFTDMDYINIDVADFGLYYGGVKNTPYDQHMAIDNIVISKSYIGPMKRQ